MASEDWASKTVVQLDAVGEEYEDYPSDGNKAEKVAWLEANVEDEEVSLIPEGQTVVEEGEGDEGAVPVIYAGTWVRLKETEDVPEECWGHVGVITFAPVTYVQQGELSPRPYEEQGEGKFIVHTRDEFGYDLQLGKDDFSAMSSAGRHEIISHG